MLDKDINIWSKEEVKIKVKDVTHGELCVFIGATMAPSWGFVVSKQERPEQINKMAFIFTTNTSIKWGQNKDLILTDYYFHFILLLLSFLPRGFSMILRLRLINLYTKCISN